jgi:Putative MetA-pathway of phenol degradation
MWEGLLMRAWSIAVFGLGFVLIGSIAGVPRSIAQELEPRAFSPNPTGMNYVIAGYSRSSGGVLFDPSVPVTNVDAEFSAAVVGYGHTFEILGRSATATLVTPYAWGNATGNVGEIQRSIERSGVADSSFQVSVNLLGAPALSPAEFARRTPETTVGASLLVTMPTGQYDASRLINIGTNRWAFRPQIGISQPWGAWTVECFGGVWLFSDNNNYLNGSRQEQAPIMSLQLHGSYTFKPRLWLAVDATGYRGGQTTVNGVDKANLQANSRIGMTLSLPLGRSQSIKLAYSDGATTRVGASFRTISLAWQFSWLD